MYVFFPRMSKEYVFQQVFAQGPMKGSVPPDFIPSAWLDMCQIVCQVPSDDMVPEKVTIESK